MASKRNTTPAKSGTGSLKSKPRKKKSEGNRQWDIEMVALDHLIPDPANARLHDEKNIETIKASLSEFDQHAPLVVQRSTNRVIVGNGRYEAMRQLGWKKALVHWVDDDNAKALRRAIVDNRAGELARWDEGALNKILSEFKFDGKLDIPGFEDYSIPEMDIDFSPILNPEQGATEFTALDINKASAKLLGQYGDGESQMVEVICPACGEIFFLRKSDVPENIKEDS